MGRKWDFGGSRTLIQRCRLLPLSVISTTHAHRPICVYEDCIGLNQYLSFDCLCDHVPALNIDFVTGYLSKPVGLALLTRWLCSCLIGSHTRNITTIIFEQIVKRFFHTYFLATADMEAGVFRETTTLRPLNGLIPANLVTALNSIPLRGERSSKWYECLTLSPTVRT